MIPFTVIAHCKLKSRTYLLRHDGEKWKEEVYEQTTFESREEAESFAKIEADKIKNLVEMEVLEFGILAELTRSGRMGRRTNLLLRDAKDASSAGWYMHVPLSFNDALDIKFESSGPNEGWTQSGCFAFKQADTLYDTDKAYQRWSDALPEIGMAVVITAASAAGMGAGKTRYSGAISFQVRLPTIDRTRLIEAFDWRMSQDDFVRFLIAGPSGDFELALAKARSNIGL